MTSSQPKINLEKELTKSRTIDHLCGKESLLQKLLGNMVEIQMEEHLGYEKHAVTVKIRQKHKDCS